MNHLSDELDSVAQNIIREKEVATEEAITAAEKARADAEPELTEVTLPDGYERHLIDYLQEQKDAFQNRENVDPLCTCSNPWCPLKRGRLPARVKMADDTEDGIREYRDQHDGDCRALKDARAEWVEKCSEVKQQLDHSLSILRGATVPDDHEDKADSSETDAESERSAADAD